MKSEFKYPHELTESELEQVYAIHRKVYVSKGVGLEFEIWKNHLLEKRYHNVTDKLIQLFYVNDSNRIDAYNIFTEPLQIEGELWSKNIEVGSSLLSHKVVKPAFKKMYFDLFSWRNDVIFLGEASVEYPAVINLLVESKYVKANDVSNLYAVFRTFIQSDDFVLYAGEHGVEIKRKTFITPTYHGCVLINDYRQTKL